MLQNSVNTQGVLVLYLYVGYRKHRSDFLLLINAAWRPDLLAASSLFCSWYALLFAMYISCVGQVSEWRTSRCWWTNPCQPSPRRHWRAVPRQVSPSTETCPSGKCMVSLRRPKRDPNSGWRSPCCRFLVIKARQTRTSRRSWSRLMLKMLSSSRSFWDRPGDRRSETNSAVGTDRKVQSRPWGTALGSTCTTEHGSPVSLHPEFVPGVKVSNKS